MYTLALEYHDTFMRMVLEQKVSARTNSLIALRSIECMICLCTRQEQRTFNILEMMLLKEGWVCTGEVSIDHISSSEAEKHGIGRFKDKHLQRSNITNRRRRSVWGEGVHNIWCTKTVSHTSVFHARLAILLLNCVNPARYIRFSKLLMFCLP